MHGPEGPYFREGSSLDGRGGGTALGVAVLCRNLGACTSVIRSHSDRLSQELRDRRDIQTHIRSSSCKSCAICVQMYALRRSWGRGPRYLWRGPGYLNCGLELEGVAGESLVEFSDLWLPSAPPQNEPKSANKNKKSFKSVFRVVLEGRLLKTWLPNLCHGCLNWGNDGFMT